MKIKTFHFIDNGAHGLVEEFEKKVEDFQRGKEVLDVSVKTGIYDFGRPEYTVIIAVEELEE